MTSVYDVILRVSFKVSFPHLYVLEVWQSRMRLCYKRLYFHVCAQFFFQVLVSPAEYNSKDTFVKTLF